MLSMRVMLCLSAVADATYTRFCRVRPGNLLLELVPVALGPIQVQPGNTGTHCGLSEDSAAIVFLFKL